MEAPPETIEPLRSLSGVSFDVLVHRTVLNMLVTKAVDMREGATCHFPRDMRFIFICPGSKPRLLVECYCGNLVGVEYWIQTRLCGSTHAIVGAQNTDLSSTSSFLVGGHGNDFSPPFAAQSRR